MNKPQKIAVGVLAGLASVYICLGTYKAHRAMDKLEPLRHELSELAPSICEVVNRGSIRPALDCNGLVDFTNEEGTKLISEMGCSGNPNFKVYLDKNGNMVVQSDFDIYCVNPFK